MHRIELSKKQVVAIVIAASAGMVLLMSLWR